MEKRDTRTAEISPDQIAAFAMLMETNLTSGDVPFRKAYLASVIDRIDVASDSIRIIGKHNRLKRSLLSATEKVPSRIQEWRTRQDSNL